MISLVEALIKKELENFVRITSGPDKMKIVHRRDGQVISTMTEPLSAKECNDVLMNILTALHSDDPKVVEREIAKLLKPSHTTNVAALGVIALLLRHGQKASVASDGDGGASANPADQNFVFSHDEESKPGK